MDVSREPRAWLYLRKGLEAEVQKGVQGEGGPVPGPLPPQPPGISRRPCPLSPGRLGRWHTRPGRCGDQRGGRDAAAAGVRLRPGPGGRRGRAGPGSRGPRASCRGALRPRRQPEPPGLRRPPEPTSQLRVRGPVGGHLLHDAAARAGLPRGAGCRLHRGAAGHWDLQPARGEVSPEGLGDTCWDSLAATAHTKLMERRFPSPRVELEASAWLQSAPNPLRDGWFPSSNPEGSAVSSIGKERGFKD